jgi:ribosome recycling factor
MGGTRERMERVLGGLQKELDQLRGGRPSAAMFDHINVEAYGQHVTMASIAQAAMKGANQVVLTTYDPALAPAVAVAIRDSGMSLNPQVEKSQVVVNIPKPSQESREEVAKIAAKQTEKAKIHIRGIRHNVNEQVKASKGLFSEDDVHRKIKDMDALTHEYEAKLVQALDKKKKDIMTV